MPLHMGRSFPLPDVVEARVPASAVPSRSPRRFPEDGATSGQTPHFIRAVLLRVHISDRGSKWGCLQSPLNRAMT